MKQYENQRDKERNMGRTNAQTQAKRGAK